MTDASDLIRRIEAAINTKSLHPEYARGLLREAKEALVREGSNLTRPARLLGIRAARLPTPTPFTTNPWTYDDEPA